MSVPTRYSRLIFWVDEIATKTTPDSIVWFDGTKAEYDRMIKIMVDVDLATPLAKRPGSYLFRSDASDVARIENCTYNK